MSFLDTIQSYNPFAATPNPVNDSDRGIQALTYFNNKMIGDYPDSYSLKVNDLLLAVDSGSQAKADLFSSGIGQAINSAGMLDYQVKGAMENLADMSQGRTPNNRDMFYNALYDRAGQITAADWVQMAPSIAADTVSQAAGDVASAAQQGAAAVTQTASILAFIGPIVVVGAILFIVTSRSKQLAGA